MPLTKPQLAIFNDNSRMRVASCGRRFGKTYLSMWEIARVARNPNKRILYLATTFRQTKAIMWELLKDQLTRRNWVKKINESELSIRLRNNSLIELRSAEAAAGLRGQAFDLAVLDECAFYDKGVWTDIVRPTLSDRPGSKALFISSPQGYNWFYDLYTGAKTRDNWASYSYSTVEGGNVPESEVEAARLDLDERTFRTEYLAKFEESGSRIYYAFDPKLNVQDYKGEIPPMLHIGIDFNVSPVTAVVGIRTDVGLHIIDELMLYNSNTEELGKAIRERYPNHRITAYPDPSGSARKTSSTKTDHVILEEYAMRVVAPRAHPPVADRINSVNRMWADAAGNRRLFVDSGCKNVIEAMLKHQYKTGSRQPDKHSGYDHTSDSLGYMIHSMFPLVRPHVIPKGPELFGVF
jgi:hypothetical protein